MNERNLFELLSELPDDYITAAAGPHKRNHTMILRFVSALAACLVLVIAAGVYSAVRVRPPQQLETTTTATQTKTYPSTTDPAPTDSTSIPQSTSLKTEMTISSTESTATVSTAETSNLSSTASSESHSLTVPSSETSVSATTSSTESNPTTYSATTSTETYISEFTNTAISLETTLTPAITTEETSFPESWPEYTTTECPTTGENPGGGTIGTVLIQKTFMTEESLPDGVIDFEYSLQLYRDTIPQYITNGYPELVFDLSNYQYLCLDIRTDWMDAAVYDGYYYNGVFFLNAAILAEPSETGKNQIRIYLELPRSLNVDPDDFRVDFQKVTNRFDQYDLDRIVIRNLK